MIAVKGGMNLGNTVFNNAGTFLLGDSLKARIIDNSVGTIICTRPETTITAQEIIGFNKIDFPGVRKLTLIDIASDLDLMSLSEQAPNLEHLILNNCSGLVASPANLQAFHQLKQRGINITLEGIQDFQNSYNTRYPAEANVTLPQAMAGPERHGANQSDTMNLTSLGRDNHNFEQPPEYSPKDRSL